MIRLGLVGRSRAPGRPRWELIKEPEMRRALTAFVILISGLIAVPVAAREFSEQKKLQEAQAVLDAAVKAPDKGIPKELLERAECIGVFPGVKKGAFIVGGEFGRGVFTCREKGGAMGAPAFFSIGGPSVGWQIGAEEADLVLLIMNEAGMQHLLKDHFTLGAEVSASAGPVGRNTQAATDLQLTAQILSWSRSRGLFAGASLEGTVVKQNKDANQDLYGKEVTAKQILVDKSMPVPSAAKPFVQTATRHAQRSS